MFISIMTLIVTQFLSIVIIYDYAKDNKKLEKELDKAIADWFAISKARCDADEKANYYFKIVKKILKKFNK